MATKKITEKKIKVKPAIKAAVMAIKGKTVTPAKMKKC
jgi:hypothetical protein